MEQEQELPLWPQQPVVGSAPRGTSHGMMRPVRSQDRRWLTQHLAGDATEA